MDASAGHSSCQHARCSRSQQTRREKAYERYIGQSERKKERREIAAAKLKANRDSQRGPCREQQNGQLDFSPPGALLRESGAPQPSRSQSIPPAQPAPPDARAAAGANP